MIITRRRKVGLLVAVMPLAALPILAFAGVPLITGNSAYFVETGATTYSLQWHWPLGLVAAFFIVGLTLIVFPRREKAPLTRSLHR